MDHHDHDTLLCHRCGTSLTPGEGNWYMVKIEAFADPTPPSLDEQEMSFTEISDEIDALIGEMSQMSEQELLDQVHRRLTLTLCGRCYRTWIEDPAS